MKKTIVLITSGQPSINPRLTKEADALSEAGYEVTVLYQYWNEWASQSDQILLKDKRWRAVRVGGAPTSGRLIYYLSRVLHRVARFLGERLTYKLFIAEIAIGRCTLLLLWKAYRLNADFYIGHNPGAIPVAALAAKMRGVKCGFDAEDFHRHEYTDSQTHPDYLTKRLLEEKYFPRYDYITTASPLISKEYSQHFPSLSFTTILNVFSRLSPHTSKATGERSPSLKLFWFSQTVGHNRGLEDIIHAMSLCGSKDIELHILGNPRQAVISVLKQQAKKYGFRDSQITFYDPVPPDEIFNLARNFDVGMATEIGVPYNRDICLTNKIFTYLQSGLAVVASDTSAQMEFINSHPGIGLIYRKNDHEALAAQIKKLLTEDELLIKMKKSNFELGQREFNWQVESLKILSIVENTLKNA